MGPRRFLERVWNLQEKLEGGSSTREADHDLTSLINQAIAKVSSDIENFRFNTAIPVLMTLAASLDRNKSVEKKSYEIFIRLLAPFAPHITNELWSRMGHKGLLEKEAWPKYNAKLLVADEIMYVVQINGKVRGDVTVAADAHEGAVVAAAKQDERVVKYLEGKKIVKQVFVKGRLVNFVVS